MLKIQTYEKRKSNKKIIYKFINEKSVIKIIYYSIYSKNSSK